MRIVKGRGKRREVIELPCGALIAQHAKLHPEQYSASHRLMCEVLGIPAFKGDF